MKIIRNVLTFALVAILVLSGCVNHSQPKNSDHKVTNVEPIDAKAVDTVTWFSDMPSWSPPSPWNTNSNTIEGAITEQTGLKFEFNIPIQDGATKLSLMLVSEETLPDVMSITNTVLAKQLIEADKVWSITELLEKYDPKSHLLTEFPEDMKRVISERDGGWYAYPSHMSTKDARKRYPPSSQYYEDALKYRNNLGIMINENILEQLGLKLEELGTEAGLTAAYQKIKDMKLTIDGEPVIPLLMDGKNYQNSTLDALQYMFGVMPVDKNGVYRDRLLASETKHALQFLYQAARAGYIDAEQLTMDGTAVQSAVATGRVFSYIGNTANTGLSDMDFWTSPGPILSSEGTKPVMGWSEKPGGGWMQTYISKATKYPEKLAKWLSYMTSNEGLLLIHFGFEDQHYIMNEQGLVVQTDEGMQALIDFAKTGVGAFWPFANMSWHDSVTQALTEKIGPNGLVAMNVQTAFGKSEHTVFYETAPFELPIDYIPPGSKLFNDQEQIKLYKVSQISKIVMAKDDAEFIRLYDELIVNMKSLGIEAIDQKINEQVQKQMNDMGISVRGVNS